MSHRTLCPSCRHRISPLALECPVCGLTLEQRTLPRPLLFQASALQASTPAKEPRRIAIATPALGRITPIAVSPESPEPEGEVSRIRPLQNMVAMALPDGLQDLLPQPSLDESFWPLVRLEFMEALLIGAINGILILVAAWQLHTSISRLYAEFWHFMLPIHFALSWAFEMIPLTLAGQSPLMGSQDLLLDSSQPERRIAFSLMHLCSVLLFPVSFFCMVLTPTHRTLGEILSGQEILLRPSQKLRS